MFVQPKEPMSVTTDDVQARESRHVLQTYRRSRSRSCAAKASACSTSTDANISTCCRASASRRSATRIRGLARGDRRAGGDAAAHVEPVLPPAAGRARRAAGAAVGAAARVLLQQRHRGGRGVPEIRAPLLVHAGRAADRNRRARRIVPRPHDGRAVGDVGRALPRRRSGRCSPA